MRFGWFDVVDDVEVAKSLFQKVEEWGRDNDMTEICGPSRFSNMEKQSMLVDGFEHVPPIGADYNFSYYPQFVEMLGFEKEVDYVQYRMKIGQVPPLIVALGDRAKEKTKVHSRPVKSKKEMLQLGHEFFGVINASYTNIFNFIPLTDKEIDWTVKENFGVADLSLISILEDEKGKTVGVAFALPSLSKSFQKSKGKLFPFGWVHILRALKHNHEIDLYLTAVLPEYMNSGIHTIYHKELNELCLERGYQYAYSSQQLENNPANRIWTKYDSELYFRRRCYKKLIAK